MILRAAPFLFPGLLAAGPLLAQEPWLQAVPTECTALEALVSFGLIDGGEAGETSVLTGIVQGGDGAACADELARLGSGQGLDDPTCREALDLFAAFGPPSPEVDPAALVHDLLTGASPEACALTVEYYGQQ
jgi:hypothetical protein